MLLGTCWFLPNPPGPSSQPWRTATVREAAPGRSGAHSFLIVQLLWPPRSSSAPKHSRSTGLGLSMFNGSKGLIWTPKPFRLLQHNGLWCGMAADGRLRVAPALCGMERDDQSGKGNGCPGKHHHQDRRPCFTWARLEPHFDSSALEPHPGAHGTHCQGPRGTSETEGNEWMNETAGVSSTAGLVSVKLWQAVAIAHIILPD